MKVTREGQGDCEGTVRSSSQAATLYWLAIRQLNECENAGKKNGWMYRIIFPGNKHVLLLRDRTFSNIGLSLLCHMRRGLRTEKYWKDR